MVTFDPHPRDGARQPRRAAHDPRPPARTAWRARRGGDARRGVHARRRAAGTAEFAEQVSDHRRGDDRGRSGLPLRTRPQGDLELLEQLGFEARPVPILEGVSSTEVRERTRAGDVEGAAKLLGRPVEVEGTVVTGDARGGTLGFPPRTSTSAPSCSCPRTASMPARPSTTAPPSRSARTRTTEAANGVSRLSFSTTRQTSTASGSSSSSGAGSATSAPSTARTSSSRRSPRRRAHAQRPETRLSAS